MKRGLLAVAAVLFAATASSSTGVAAPPDAVADSYIVVFKAGAAPNVPVAAQR
jgi:hypothetical protein